MNALKIKKINPNASMPIKATEGAAGYDLCSVENVKILPNSTALIATGLQLSLIHISEIIKNGFTNSYMLEDFEVKNQKIN